jgi:hypothetical protein
VYYLTLTHDTSLRVKFVKVDILYKWLVLMYIKYATMKRFNCVFRASGCWQQCFWTTFRLRIIIVKQETRQETEVPILFLFQLWIDAKIRVASANQMRVFVP